MPSTCWAGKVYPPTNVDGAITVHRRWFDAGVDHATDEATPTTSAGISSTGTATTWLVSIVVCARAASSGGSTGCCGAGPLWCQLLLRVPHPLLPLKCDNRRGWGEGKEWWHRSKKGCVIGAYISLCEIMMIIITSCIVHNNMVKQARKIFWVTITRSVHWVNCLG